MENCPKIKSLFIKKQKKVPLEKVENLEIKDLKILGQIEQSAQRTVLLNTFKILEEYNIPESAMRENIVLENFDIHALDSGTVIQIGKVQIRLNYHCEPCKMVAEFVSPQEIVHKRGYLGNFLNDGVIQIGDDVTIIGKLFESIPYEIPARIKWFLDKDESIYSIVDLCKHIGLSHHYYRAVPQYLKHIDSKYSLRVVANGEFSVK